LVGQIGIGFVNPIVEAGDTVIRPREVIQEAPFIPPVENPTESIGETVTVNVT